MSLRTNNLAVLALVLPLSLTLACGPTRGGGSGDDENNANNVDPNNGDPNNGDPNNVDPNNGVTNNGQSNNGDPNNGQTNNGQTNNGQTNNGDPNNGQTNNGQTNNGDPNNGQTNNGQSNNGQTNNGQTNNGQVNHPPSILTLSVTPFPLTEGEIATFSALVSDPEGDSDVVSARLFDGERTYGDFSYVGDGVWQVSVSWDELGSLEFEADATRTFSATFTDRGGESATAEVDLLLTCGELSACASTCVDRGVDTMNCGQCGMACAPNRICIDGECSSPCPDASSLVGLVNNEVDYDQPSTDDREFIELYNGSASDVCLTNLRLVLVNGNDNQPYSTLDLSMGGDILPPGGYLVVASDNVVVDPGALVIRFDRATNRIQNGDVGPDGVALMDVRENTLLDALSYEGELTSAEIDAALYNLVEGTPLVLTDPGDVDASLSRTPNGRDTNNADADWQLLTPTPGAQN